MRQIYIFIGIIVFSQFLIFNTVKSQDYQEIPALTRRVTDLTGLLSQGEIRAIESKLSQFEQEKGSQIVVLVVSTTQPEEIEEYSIRVAEEWKIGRESVDDGIILLVAKDDRKLRIEVGYGLEGAVPDAYAKRIIEQIILPQFRTGDFYHGIDSGVDALIGLVAGEELPEPTGGEYSDLDAGGSELIGIAFVMAFILSIFLNAFLKKKLGKGWGSLVTFIIILVLATIFINIFIGLIVAIMVTIFSVLPRGRGGGGTYYGGGGFSGGSSFGGGGFSGGGGSFGGGGASGGW